jgi:DNA-binding NarL/FixJ family response regulator
MPRLGGIGLITDIRRTNWRLKILVLSMDDDAQFVARALKVGPKLGKEWNGKTESQAGARMERPA